MAKKIKNPKLLHPKSQSSPHPTAVTSVKSAFSNFSQKIQKAKEKKKQKIHETKDRLMSKKKDNKIMKVPNKFLKNNNKKINKFALLDDGDAYQPTNKLTHRGTDLDQVKHFNDMHFDNDDAEGYSDMDDQLHAQANFHGFDQQEKPQVDDNRRKSKNQIYKQIIQKSKMHKKDRQQQYQQNFNAAVQLDDQFNDFVSNLKFRNNDSKVRDKIQNTDTQYERLMNQLKQDQRVVANKVVDNNKKGNQKIRKKKNIQLIQLMKNSDDQEEEDIRGWVKGLGSGDEEQQGSQEQEGQSQEDQIDDVQLSSGDEEQDENQDQNEDQGQNEDEDDDSDEDDDQEDQQDNDEADQSEEVGQKRKIIIKSGSSDQQQQEQDEEEDEIEESQQSEQQIVIPKKTKNKHSQQIPSKSGKHKQILKPNLKTIPFKKQNLKKR